MSDLNGVNKYKCNIKIESCYMHIPFHREQEEPLLGPMEGPAVSPRRPPLGRCCCWKPLETEQLVAKRRPRPWRRRRRTGYETVEGGEQGCRGLRQCRAHLQLRWYGRRSTPEHDAEMHPSKTRRRNPSAAPAAMRCRRILPDIYVFDDALLSGFELYL